MKKRVLTVALIAVLGTMAVGCQKETIVDLQGSAAETIRKCPVAIQGEDVPLRRG